MRMSASAEQGTPCSGGRFAGLRSCHEDRSLNVSRSVTRIGNVRHRARDLTAFTLVRPAVWSDPRSDQHSRMRRKIGRQNARTAATVKERTDKIDGWTK
jgi:hypothetical protein